MMKKLAAFDLVIFGYIGIITQVVLLFVGGRVESEDADLGAMSRHGRDGQVVLLQRPLGGEL